MLLLFITTATALAWLTSHEPEPPTSDLTFRVAAASSRVTPSDCASWAASTARYDVLRCLRWTLAEMIQWVRSVLGESSRTGGSRSNSAQALNRVRPSTNHPPPTTTWKRTPLAPMSSRGQRS